LQLLFYYKNKTTISTIDLNQQISKDKFKITTSTEYLSNNIYKYLINECKKDNINIYIIKYLVEHGADINEATKYGETALFNTCKNGNEVVVKYLVEHGADVNKEIRNGKTPLFEACSSGNEAVVKYLVEHGANVNKKMNGFSDCFSFSTPLFNACKSGNEAVVRY